MSVSGPTLEEFSTEFFASVLRSKRTAPFFAASTNFLDPFQTTIAHFLVAITMMAQIVHYYRKTEVPHSLLPSVKEELKDLGLAAERKTPMIMEPPSF